MPTENLIDANGTNLYIATAKSENLPEDSPDPWTLIGEIASIGALTFAANEVRSTALGRVRDIVGKGVEPMPSVPLTFNKISGGDEGQEALRTAKNDRSQDQWYWFMIEFPDVPEGSPPGDPTTVTFKAKVIAFTPFNEIAVDSVVQGSATLIIDEDTFTETDAAEAA